MKVKITGSVQNGNGPLKGIVNLKKEEAERLLTLGVAEKVEEPAKSEETSKEKAK